MKPSQAVPVYDYKKLLCNIGSLLLCYGLVAAAYFSVEVAIGLFLHTQTPLVYSFGLCWSLIFAAIPVILPRKAGRIFFGITYFLFAGWGMAQLGHFDMFHKLMWFSSTMYTGEGMVFVWDVIRSIPPLWWVTTVIMIAIGVLVICFFPKRPKAWPYRVAPGIAAIVCATVLASLPSTLFLRDNDVWGTRSEYGQYHYSNKKTC